jgi:hypothetical protein
MIVNQKHHGFGEVFTTSGRTERCATSSAYVYIQHGVWNDAAQHHE